MENSPTWIGIYISWTGMIISLGMSFHAVRQAGSARRHRIAIESPHFIFGRMLVLQSSAFKNPQGMPGDAMVNPPDWDRVPEDYPLGSPVLMAALNKGAEARQVKLVTSSDFKADLSWLNVARGFCIGPKEELQFVYPYDPARRGKHEKITLKFLTVGNEKVTQSFCIRHGLLR